MILSFFRLVNIKGQHIWRFFTFLAGLIILAHAVVPHHHHFEIAHSAYENSTRESSTHNNKTENPYSHCHAFNVLVSKQIASSSLNQSLSNYFSFFLTRINADIEFLPVQNITSKFLDAKILFLKQFLITAHTLRGPPTIA